jgi:hypothetical protein
MSDVYEMMTYLLIIVISCIVMTVWLKRKARKRKSE